MTTAAALLAQQPVAFWLAVVGGLLAVAIASGRRMAVIVALGAALGAVVAAIAPRAPGVQAAAALVGAAVGPGLLLLRRRPSRGASPRRAARAAAPAAGDARLLGRTARACAPFVRGEGDVELDGRARAARCLSPDEVVGAGVRVRIVRVGEAALVVRPLEASAG